MKPTIKIEPSNYKGWSLCYQESHDHQSDWQARKGAAFLSAAKPEALIWEIDKAETVTVRLAFPIKAIWKSNYTNKNIPVDIHTVCEGRIYFCDNKGEEHTEFLKDLTLEKEIKFIHNSAANAKILAKHQKLNDKIRFIRTMGDELLKRLKPVTEADVLLRAKESNA